MKTMKAIKILIIVTLIALLTACSDVVTEEPIQGDFVKADSLDVSIDSIYTTVLNLKAVKGMFANKALASAGFVGGVTYDGLIGNFSEAVITVIDTYAILTALAKAGTTKRLLKTSIRGSALNEYGENISFDDMVLEAYKIVGDEDTVDIKMNIVDNLIVAKMDGVETIESYNKAKAIVLSDLNLDSTFALNSTFDDADVSDKDAGAMVAIGGLMMRSAQEFRPFKPTDWDLLPYLNTEDEEYSLSYWTTTLIEDEKIISDYIGFLKDSTYQVMASYKEFSDDIYNTKYAYICTNAQKSVNSLNDNGYRNLARFTISNNVVSECLIYMHEFYYSRIPIYTE